MGLDPSTTLHDVRWGDDFNGQFVWVFEISGSVPASHLAAGTPAPPACGSPRSTSRWVEARYVASPGRVRSCGPACTCWTEYSTTTSDTAGGRTARRGDRAPVAGDQLRMAHDACRALRRQPGPVHGPSQGQPCPGGLCPRRRTSRPGPCRQGCHFRTSWASPCTFVATSTWTANEFDGKAGPCPEPGRPFSWRRFLRRAPSRRQKVLTSVASGRRSR